MSQPDKHRVDYSVYLVTDSTPAVLGTRDLVAVVEAALRGGATVVQLRDKDGEHARVVATARALHALTRRYGVPLLVNDRVDVAVEIGCEGVHIGQDDMDVPQARRLLGPDKIIGVSANTPAEAVAACRDGADYLGLGTVYATSTKKNIKSIIGPHGVRDILTALEAAGHASVPTVCIGGISTSNARTVLVDSRTPRGTALAGVAVVSAIVAAPEPDRAAQEFNATVLCARVPDVVLRVAATRPVSHNMTNLVVQNFAANVALAVGASPIMANFADEAPDLARLGGALVVNMGTVTPDGLHNFAKALQAYNQAGRPVILDPVGAGATTIRRQAAAHLLASGGFALIKGNESELLALASLPPSYTTPQQDIQPHDEPQQRGVDSSSSLTPLARTALAHTLALRHACVVVLTGPIDTITDGRRTAHIHNGHALLAEITGSGCTLGTVLSAALAAWPAHDAFTAAVAATVVFGIAAERAVAGGRVHGPGSFVPVFLDELYAIRKATERGDVAWAAAAKVDVDFKGVADG